MNKVYSITFGGIGGQGVLKASEICGWAAMFAGYHVKKSEVHGMSQRGGSVESHALAAGVLVPPAGRFPRLLSSRGRPSSWFSSPTA
jgi:indolepyruvate ferredoxin oxidoreductase beta subunit